MSTEVSPQDAVDWAENFNGTTGLSPGKCDHGTGVAYTPGHSWANSHSNSPSAWQHWLDTPASYKHQGDTNPPAGALMFWEGGQYGHAALSVGNGMVGSTDIGGTGTYKIVPFTDFKQKWGNLQYLGWTDPYFNGMGPTPILSPSSASAHPPSGGTAGGGTGITGLLPVGSSVNTPGVTAAGVNAVNSYGTANDLPAGTQSTAGRIARMALGAGLVILGVVLIFRRDAITAGVAAAAPEVALASEAAKVAAPKPEVAPKPKPAVKSHTSTPSNAVDLKAWLAKNHPDKSTSVPAKVKVAS